MRTRVRTGPSAALCLCVPREFSSISSSPGQRRVFLLVYIYKVELCVCASVCVCVFRNHVTGGGFPAAAKAACKVMPAGVGDRLRLPACDTFHARESRAYGVVQSQPVSGRDHFLECVVEGGSLIICGSSANYD